MFIYSTNLYEHPVFQDIAPVIAIEYSKHNETQNEESTEWLGANKCIWDKERIIIKE